MQDDGEFAGGRDPGLAQAFASRNNPAEAATRSCVNSGRIRTFTLRNDGAQSSSVVSIDAGVGVWTAVSGSREGYRSGTSFAAPFATAILSLMSQDRPITQKETLLEEAKISPLSPRGRDPIYGRGLLQAPQTCFQETGRIADTAPQTEVAPR